MKRVILALLLALALAAGIVWSKRQQLLVHAAIRGDRLILQGLLVMGADPNSNATGSSPLYAAVWHRQLDAATGLIARGADVNAAEPSGVRPLITAAANGDDAMVHLLLSHGADVNVSAACGTALDVARANHHASTAAILAAAASSRNR